MASTETVQLSANGWVVKRKCDAMDCPAFRETQVLSFVTTWMDLEDAMLRERSQAPKDNVRSLFHTKSE